MSEHEELPVLDESELAMLAAFQAEENPPSAIVHDVRARLLETTAVAPPTGSVIKGPWALWAGVAVVAAAAAAVLALNMGGSDATAVSQSTAQQAVDTRENAEHAERAISKEKATPTRRATPPRRAQSQPETVAVPQPVVEPEPVEKSQPATPEIAAPKPPKKRRAIAPAPAEEPTTPAEPDSSLAAETRMLDRARQAVADNRPKDALAILAEAASKFPGGVLAQERAALKVVALCDAGRVETGRKAAASFVASHPRSALRARVESACPDAP